MTTKLLFKEINGIYWVEPAVAKKLEFYRQIYALLKNVSVPSYDIEITEDGWNDLRESSEAFFEDNLSHMAKEGYGYIKKDLTDALYAYCAIGALIDAGWDYSKSETDTARDRVNWGLQCKVIFSPLAEQEFRLQTEDMLKRFTKLGIREYDILPLEWR